MRKVKICDINFDVITTKETIEFIEKKILNSSKAHYIHTANVDHVVMADEDPEFKSLINRADLVTADGMPIVWFSSLFGCKLPERVTGADLSEKLCKYSSEKGFKLFFLGAATGVAEKAKQRMQKKYPNVEIVGVYSPSKEELQNKESNMKIINKINKSGANILLVAFGAPKQEKWINNHLSYLQTTINIGVGASIDFMAGEVKRAPKILQSLGLEWLYRLIKDPKRLAHRYLIRDSKIIPIIIKSLVR
jgi:N-acetylglucosaminyldiphosphoundecaprenol N-acetyl-beta-D-mannosaminyltransferase